MVAEPVTGSASTASGSGSRPRRLARTFTADLRPLRTSPAFRRFWIGEAVSATGTQVVVTTVLLQVYTETHSNFAVGAVGAVTFASLVVFGMVGGMIADAADRRVLALLTAGGMMLTSAALTLQALLDAPMWVLFGLIGLQTSLSALDAPIRRTFAARLLPTDMMPAVGALEGFSMTVALTGGPLLAGLLVSTAGFTEAYAVDMVSYLGLLYATWRLPSLLPEGGGTRAGLRSILDGFRLLRERPVLLMTFLVDLDAMIFGMPRVLFASLAVTQFHGGPRTTGLLYAALSIGGTLVAATGGWMSRVRRQGLVVAVAIGVWGAAVASFGLAQSLWLALALLVIAGAADTVSAVLRITIQQVSAPDAVRGRIAGLFMVTVTAGPSLGDLGHGVLAGFTSPGLAAFVGGVACLLGLGGLLLAVPSFVRYDGLAPAPAPDAEAGPRAATPADGEPVALVARDQAADGPA
ncbi:MFS transporter [Frankia sp. CN7]|uniref:MFS transporter n=1 Tax=Frankia nepalensis TaxID=1836974 RepID=A0A937USI6_9ACTN|nr:MFS transporter [Frankia nepalensis]MBL7510995.1 MFS transporter [Frankia nepalensis]MBL7630300.1 MFS transporter [Frankia nepalensis]